MKKKMINLMDEMEGNGATGRRSAKSVKNKSLINNDLLEGKRVDKKSKAVPEIVNDDTLVNEPDKVINDGSVLANVVNGDNVGVVEFGVSKDHALKSYLRLVSQMPYLSDAEERLLVIKAGEGDEAAVEMLIKSHLRLVVKVAFGYRRYGLSMMDLISEGNMGLLTAVRKFDASKNNRLSTYAMWWIKAMIQTFILKSWSVVKIASTAAERTLFFHLQKIRQKLSLEKGLGMNENEINKTVKLTGVDRDSVKSMDLRLSGGDLSMDTPVGHGDDSASLGELMASGDHGPDKELELSDQRKNVREAFRKALSELSDREREIVICRLKKDMGDDVGSNSTLEAIGIRFGISSERVRQIANKALEKIRLAMSEQRGQNYMLS